MKPPLVSVFIAACRTQPDHLRAAIESALAQTERDIEVLVADDSADDRLRALCTAFADPRLHYMHNQPALGPARNHWAGLAQARGEFFAVLNHDDLLAPRFLATLMAALRTHPQAVLAFCDHWVCDQSGQVLQGQTEAVSARWGRSTLAAGLHQPFVRLVLAQTLPLAMGALWRRSAVPIESLAQPGPAQAGPAYDLWLAYLLARGGGAACYAPERLSSWRDHAGSLTRQRGADALLGAALCWQAMAQDPACAAWRPAARARAAAAWADCALHSLRGRGAVGSAPVSAPREPRRLALASLRARPSWRGMAAWAWATVQV